MANTPFDATVFKAACEAIAPFGAATPDDNLWSFPFNPCGEPRLIVAVGTKTAATCGELLRLWDCLWTFTRVEGVEPTNNAAERALRHAVI